MGDNDHLDSRTVDVTASAQEMSLRGIFQQMPAFMAVLRGPQHVIEMANEQFCQLIGCPNSVGRPLREALPDLAGQGCVDVLDRLYAAGDASGSANVRVMFRQRTDVSKPVGPARERIVEFACRPLQDSAVRVAGILLHGAEVAIHGQADLALQESAGLLRALADTTGDVIFAKDRRGRLIFANPATLALIGKTLDQVLGRTDVEFLQDKEAARRVMANDERIMASGAAEDLEEIVPLPDGSRRVWLSSKMPYRNAVGEVIGLLGVSRDITERKDAENQIRQRQRAEAALRQSEDRHRSVLENMSEGLMLFDAEKNLVYQNPASLRIHGFDPNDAGLIGREKLPVTWNAWDQDGRAITFDEWPVSRVFRGERFQDQVLRVVRTETGREFYGSYNGASITDADGRIALGFITIRDITAEVRARLERERWEAALFETKRKLDAALIAGEVGTFEWDITNQLVGGDANFGRMFGIKLNEQGIAPLSDYVAVMHPDDQERVRQRIALTIMTGIDYEIEYRVITSGKPRWLLVRAKPERDETGKIVRAAGVCLDVTDRKNAEEALRVSEQRLRQLAEAMPQIVWVTRADGYLEYFNCRWYEFTGVPDGSTNGDGWNGMFHPEDQGRTWEAWRRSLATGEPYEIEYRLRRHDGEYRWFLGRALAVKDASGQIVKWFGTCTDVHDAKLAREELQKAKDAAEAASKAKDHLLAVVSHELRTPLNPVLALTSYLQDKPEIPEELREDLATIRRNIEHEARIVDDLLNVTRLSREKIVLHPEVVDLHVLIRTVMGQFQPQIDSRNIEFSAVLEARSHYVWADPGRMQQVLSNLLHNAVKFTSGKGRITVSTMTPAEGRIRVEVTDTGVGIDPAVLPKLFSPFEQGEKTTTRKYGGLGLGLAITRGIVELHRGTVMARSEGQGKGATFQVELDTIPMEPEKPVQKVSDRKTATECRRILLVEDHPDTLKTMQRLLVSLGYNVITAASVAEAKDKIETERFDLLISDIGLPDGSGLEVMQELRRRSSTQGIALSGYGHEEDIRRSHDAGFMEHLVKPVNFQKLDAVLQRLQC